jgi:uncharacterized protein YjbJ (UPF0337 family)
MNKLPFDEPRMLHATRRAIVNRACYQEKVMNKDQVKGRAAEAKGKVKEIAGKVVGNRKLEQEGKIQVVAGKVRAGYGDLKDDIKKATS